MTESDKAVMQQALEALIGARPIDSDALAYTLHGQAIGALFETTTAQPVQPLPVITVTKGERDGNWQEFDVNGHPGLIRVVARMEDDNTDLPLGKLVEQFLLTANFAQTEQTATQWQKRHPARTENVWENTDEHDANWWATQSKGWEIRALYTATQIAQPVQPAVCPNLVDCLREGCNQNGDGSPCDMLWMAAGNTAQPVQPAAPKNITALGVV